MTDGYDGPERRAKPRAKVSVSFSETDPRTATPITDVSETGAFVLTDTRVAIGTVIELRVVVLPEEPTVFSTQARVVRHGDDPRGLGVEFIDLSEAMRSVVARLCEADKAQRHRTSRRGRRWR